MEMEATIQYTPAKAKELLEKFIEETGTDVQDAEIADDNGNIYYASVLSDEGTLGISVEIANQNNRYFSSTNNDDEEIDENTGWEYAG